MLSSSKFVVWHCGFGQQAVECGVSSNMRSTEIGMCVCCKSTSTCQHMKGRYRGVGGAKGHLEHPKTLKPLS